MPKCEEKQVLTLQEMKILLLIPQSKKDAISRETLSMMLEELSDRSVRRTIHSLRAKGYPIMSDTKKGGYYLATDQAEIAQFVAQQKHRIRSIQKSITIISKANMLNEELKI